jgi:hypothetical protein
MRFLSSSIPLSLALAGALSFGAAPAHAEDTRARLIAALPFGVGQFQNGDVSMGLVFAAGEAILGGASIAMVVVFNRLTSASLSPPPPGRGIDFAALNDRLAGVTTANRVLFTAWATFTVLGVVEAEVRLGAARTTPRDSQGPSVAATAAPVPGGALIGLRAKF